MPRHVFTMMMATMARVALPSHEKPLLTAPVCTSVQSITLKVGQSSLTMQMDGTINLKGMQITIEGTVSVDVKGNTGATLECGSSSVKLDPATLTASSTMSALKGTAQVQVQGAMVQVSGNAMVQVSGAMIMIG